MSEEKDKEEKKPVDVEVDSDSTPPDESSPEATPEMAPENAPEPTASPAPVAQAPAATTAPVAAAPQPTQPPAFQPNAPAAGTAPAAPIAPPTPQQKVQALNADAAGIQNDMALGHIDRKTYSDLYANKSTLGKIGTLFGMMLSGAGSGLSHQPNSLLEMMNRELDRDLDAQKAGNVNAQNWYNSANLHEQQKAHNFLANAEAYKTATAADLERYKILRQNPGADLQGSTTARNAMGIGAVQEMQHVTNNLPDGSPAKANGQATLDNFVKPALAADINKRNTQHVQREQLQKTIQQQQNGTANLRAPVINEERFKQGVQSGANAENLGLAPDTLKGEIASQDVPKIQDEQKKLEQNRSAFADADESFRKLDAMKNAGQVPAADIVGHSLGGLGALIGSAFGIGGAGVGTGVGALAGAGVSAGAQAYERARDIEVHSLASKLTGGSAEERENTIKSLLPSWTDNDATRARAYQKLVQHFKDQKDAESAPTMTRYGLKAPFPNTTFKSAKHPTISAASPQQGAK